METKRTRLQLDIESLLPSEEFLIGSQSITLRPLSIRQYKLVVGKVKSLIEYCKEQGITETNFRENDKFISLAEIIIDKFPELLEEVSNIAAEDLQQLPLDIIVSLIDACLNVNLKSKDSLMGNFKSLTEKIQKLGLGK